MIVCLLLFCELCPHEKKTVFETFKNLFIVKDKKGRTKDGGRLGGVKCKDRRA